MNSQTQKIAKRLNLTYISDLDPRRTYVVLCKNKTGQKVILKTDHFEHEAAILKILHYDSQDKVILPKLYNSSDQYIVIDYLGSKMPRIADNNLEVTLEGQKLAKKLIDLWRLLDRNLTKLKPCIKDEKDELGRPAKKTKEWLRTRILRWQNDEEIKKKDKLEPKIVKRILAKVNSLEDEKLILSFGAFSPEHTRIINNKLAVFDFGRHIRWAPRPYDLAYLFWGYLMLICRQKTKISIDNLLKLAQTLLKFNIKELKPKNKNHYSRLFWSCILERMSGISKDLGEIRKYNPAAAKKLKKIQLEILA